jgi:hypothetical protein
VKFTHKSIAALSILTITLLACQLAGDLADTRTSVSTPTHTPRPTSSAHPTRTPLVIRAQGSQMLISGGFKFAPLVGFDWYNNNSEAFMISPDKNISVILVSNAPHPGEHINTTLKQIAEYLVDQYQNATSSERQEIRHAGVPGVTADITGMDAGVPVQVRATVLRPQYSKQLIIYVAIHGSQIWQQQGEEVYSTVLENITFFEITPMADCPVSNNRSYGYTRENPIRIGGNSSDGEEREHDYLGSLLGPHGELVSYIRQDSNDSGEGAVDEYAIWFGNEFGTIYFDAHTYQAPKAPFGMTCSGPFPEPAPALSS